MKIFVFGPEFKFIKEMKIISEKNYDCCNSAVELILRTKRYNLQNSQLTLKIRVFLKSYLAT